MTLALQHFIAGRAVAASDGRLMDLVCPVDERVFATAALGTAVDVDSAVKAARAQLDGGEWSRLDGARRALLLNKLATLVERDAAMIADMDARAIGRLPSELMMLDLPNAIGSLRAAAGWADKIEGRTIPTSGYMGMQTLSYTQRVPVGVVAAIIPWNTPFMITNWKVGSALAAGCTIVLKPAEETPFSAIHLARLCREAGFPDGVVNVVTGDGEVVGRALCEHVGVDKVSFTGGPAAGREVQRIAGQSFKRITLELGGKSPQIVFADVSLATAVQGCAIGLFFNQGQICVSGSRILVHRSIADQFAAAFADAAASIKVGDPSTPGVQMGPLAKKQQFERVNGYIKKGIADGARLLAGGVAPHKIGWFVKPTVFTDVENTMVIAREEIFGPVGVIIPFDTDEQAIAIANDTSYGLSATVWTSDLARAHKVAQAVKAGAISINCFAPFDPQLPWGGFKTSGIGRECGLSGIHAYTEEKAITVLLP